MKLKSILLLAVALVAWNSLGSLAQAGDGVGVGIGIAFPENYPCGFPIMALVGVVLMSLMAFAQD